MKEGCIFVYYFGTSLEDMDNLFTFVGIIYSKYHILIYLCTESPSLRD